MCWAIRCRQHADTAKVRRTAGAHFPLHPSFHTAVPFFLPSSPGNRCTMQRFDCRCWRDGMKRHLDDTSRLQLSSKVSRKARPAFALHTTGQMRRRIVDRLLLNQIASRTINSQIDMPPPSAQVVTDPDTPRHDKPALAFSDRNAPEDLMLSRTFDNHNRWRFCESIR